MDVKLEGSAVTALFSETQSRFVITVSPAHQQAFEAAIPEAKHVGVITDEATLVIEANDNETWINMPVADLFAAWKGAIPCLLNSED